jgi:hypothetical protein
MANEKFSISDALSYGWNTFKANAGFFIGLMVVMALLTMVPDIVVDKMFARGTAMSIVFK